MRGNVLALCVPAAFFRTHALAPWVRSSSSRGDFALVSGPAPASVVLDKIVVDLGGLEPSYLGPPETER